MKSILDGKMKENARLKRLLINRPKQASLQAENRRLRERLEQAEQASSATLAKRQLRSETALTHLSGEYDKLRAQLLKVSLDNLPFELEKNVAVICWLTLWSRMVIPPPETNRTWWPFYELVATPSEIGA